MIFIANESLRISLALFLAFVAWKFVLYLKGHMIALWLMSWFLMLLTSGIQSVFLIGSRKGFLVTLFMLILTRILISKIAVKHA